MEVYLCMYVLWGHPLLSTLFMYVYKYGSICSLEYILSYTYCTSVHATYMYIHTTHVITYKYIHTIHLHTFKHTWVSDFPITIENSPVGEVDRLGRIRRFE